MKSLMVAIAILLSFATASVLLGIFTEDVADRIEGYAETAGTAVKNSNFDKAAKELERLKTYLMSKKNILSLSEDHISIEIMENAVNSAMHYIEDKSQGDARSQLETVKTLCGRLREHGKLRYVNVF